MADNDNDTPSTESDLPKQYDPAAFEGPIFQRWLEADAFGAEPDARERRYVVMMPLPNVTGALHMGHAMDNVMQDMLIRWHRMLGDNTLWMPGTDHAGIATQAVVEKRLLELEGKTRHDIGREALVARIWDWKDQYQQRIVSQLQSMGCSADWSRQRFTKDAVCARAVRHTFFHMFADGLIYRGNRLVNWDCHLQTAVSDDEIRHETVQGYFWHLKYPVIDPQPGEPDHVVVATTRPETMLGDTAVATHPDPKRELDRKIESARERLQKAPDKEKEAASAELARLEGRRETHLPQLEQLAEMARAGRQVMLPLQQRPMPLILDEWAKPELGSGCVKITPGHDQNDYDVWTRHRDEIDIVNILNPDGTLNENAGNYRDLDRFEGRDRVVEDLEKQGLLVETEEREVEIGHSDRSRTPVEPYLSRQWFVRMSDVEGGIICGRGTDKEFTAAGLAQAAMNTVEGDWRSPTDKKLTFHPDPVRYGNTYLNWLSEKRDWCISRQLWWGHRIPIWTGSFAGGALAELVSALAPHLQRDDFCAWATREGGHALRLAADTETASLGDETFEVLLCLRDTATEEQLGATVEGLGLVRDPDVLDTWFSSSLWPHSTLGWPDPESAEINDGQRPLGSQNGQPSCLDYYFPGSCLVTGRDIITLWVARMNIMGLYNLGDVPFTDCFIHANILDGKGERMSKSKGNGIDPVDIIQRYGADAMRYVVCDMQTGSQDIRLPVQAISPFTGKMVDLATAKHGQSIFTYLCPETGKEFDVLGSMPDLPAAELLSDRFDVGRNFCNKLWNAARFTLMNLKDVEFQPRQLAELQPEDRWILSRLRRACADVQQQLERYNPSAAVAAARDFFWSELCDWYLELIKPRLKDAAQAPVARQVLAVAVDQVLRLLHPFVPFITEALWAKLHELAPERGVDSAIPCPALLVHAPWPEVRDEWLDAALEDRIGLLQELVRAVREIRAKHNVAPRQTLTLQARATGESAGTIDELTPLLTHMAVLGSVEVSADATRAADAASAVVRDVEIFVPGVVDLEKERARLQKTLDNVTKRADGARKKLANEKFLQNAAAEIVQRERDRLVELEKEQATLKKLLDGLG